MTPVRRDGVRRLLLSARTGHEISGLDSQRPRDVVVFHAALQFGMDTL